MNEIVLFAPMWRKSSFSESGNCVEVANLADGTVVVRDTKSSADGKTLSFQPSAWGIFTQEIRRHHSSE
jgi:hypothetical protein